MDEKIRVLLADDDTEFCARMSAVLDSADDFELVGIAENGEKALSAVNELRPDVLIIELMLPVMDGWSVCAHIREKAKTPIIMLTAKSEVNDRITGLEMGADDYLVKPYELDELSARVRALLRRSAGRADPIIERGALRISPATREVTFNGEPVILSSKEYALLAALAERQGVVWSRSQLEEKLYNWDNTVGSNAIEVHIHHLRKKLSDNAIKTVRGVGYLLET